MRASSGWTRTPLDRRLQILQPYRRGVLFNRHTRLNGCLKTLCPMMINLLPRELDEHVLFTVRS
jgi:hypothetical protein